MRTADLAPYDTELGVVDLTFRLVDVGNPAQGGGQGGKEVHSARRGEEAGRTASPDKTRCLTAG